MLRFFSGAFGVVAFALLLDGCSSNDIDKPVDCATTDLAITVASIQNIEGCQSASGKIEVAATGGKSPYSFSSNGGTLQSSTTFTNLGAGTYTMLVKDGNGCEKTVSATITASGSSLTSSASATADSQCLTDNGAITMTTTGGVSPYQYKLDDGAFGSSASFTNVKNGAHTVLVKDAGGCQISVGVTVDRGNTGISFSGEIKTILDTRCSLSGCHAAGTGSRDWTNLDNLKANATAIKSRTASKSMPPVGSTALTQDQITQIACWVDDGAVTNN
jgi:hypothetical protein